MSLLSKVFASHLVARKEENWRWREDRGGGGGGYGKMRCVNACGFCVTTFPGGGNGNGSTQQSKRATKEIGLFLVSDCLFGRVKAPFGRNILVLV